MPEIEVGDRVTYRNKITGEIRQSIKLNSIEFTTNEEILKIERPKYEVVEEKKELLTEEEREFLKDMCKYFDVTEICFNDTYISIYDYEDNLKNMPDYPESMSFTNIKKI